MKAISVIEAKFLRHHLSSEQTKLWREISAVNKAKAYSLIALNPGEQIALCYYPDDSYWWIITNMQLVIYDSIEVGYVPFKYIKKTGLQSIYTGQESKSDNTSIDIWTREKSLMLKVEKGTWHAILSIINFLKNDR